MAIIGSGQLALTDLNDAIISGTPPVNPTIGALWIDESTKPKTLKKWNGNSWIVIGEIMDDGTGIVITDIIETLGNMANDNVIDFNERQVIKDRLTEIIGFVIADATTVLPTTATLDTSLKGSFAVYRKRATDAGITSSDTGIWSGTTTYGAVYNAVATKYNALKTYLEGFVPIDSWDLRDVNKNIVITVVKADFRKAWMEYYQSLEDIAEATVKKLQENVDNITIGGRNFWSNGDLSIPLNEARWKTSYTGQTINIADISAQTPPFQFALYVKNTTNANGGVFFGDMFLGEVANAMIGKELTIQFWLKYQNIVKGVGANNNGRFGELVIEGETSTGTKVYSYPSVLSGVVGTNTTWTKHSQTIKITLPTNAVKLTKISMKHGLEGATGEFWTTGIKVETGNKVTDWSEDPLDMQGVVYNVQQKITPTSIVDTVTSSTKYQQDIASIAKLLTLSTSSQTMTFNASDVATPSAQVITIDAKVQNLTGTTVWSAIPYNTSGTPLTAITLGGSGNARTLTNTQWLSTFAKVVITATLSGYSDTVTIVKVKDGAKGDIGNTGGTGASGKDAINGFLTNESITLPAENNGTVAPADLAKATGTFEVYDGITKKTGTGTGITYAVTVQTGCTVSITTAGVYTVTAMSTDFASATMTAVYNGVTLTKILSLSKSKKGDTGTTGKGVASIVEQYYLSTSSSTQVGGSWVTTVPTWVDGRFMWTRSVITYTDTSELITNAICVTGGKGSTGGTGATGVGVSTVDVQYYLSTSATVLTGGSWLTTAPAWQNGKYMWSKTVTTYTNSNVVESSPVCITGAKGDTGATGATGASGKGVTSIVEEYYLSTSATAQTGASWVTSPPTWVDGRYMWTRSVITYTEGSTTTTSPVNVTGGKGSTGNTGATGNGITSVDVQYYLSTSSTALANGSWSTTAPTWVDGKFMWSKTVTAYTSGGSSESTPVCITGAKGSTGATGSTGASGKGISSAVVTYQNHTNGNTAPTGSWVTTVPAPVQGQYLWTRTITTYTDSSSITTYSVAYTATNGQNGSDGKGISSTTIAYQLHTNGTTAPTGTWVVSPPTPVKGQYLWTRTVIAYTDNSNSTSYSTSYYATDGQKGDKGEKGDTGTSVTSITEYYLATSASSGVTTSTSGWTTAIQTMTTTNKYLWNYEKVDFSDGSSQSTIPVIMGVYGDTGGTGSTGATGRSITGITEHYLATSASSGVVRATAGWSTTPQNTTTTNKYLWNYETVTWSSAPTTTYVEPIIIGVHGDTGNAGKGISSATVTYQNHTNGTTAPTGTWSSTIPATVKGQYLWTRTVTVYTDSASVTTYSVAYNATDGQNGSDGKGISSTAIAYQNHTNGTTAPTGTWVASPPTPVQGQYLWTRTIITYTDNSNSTSYSTAYHATNGTNGKDGTNGVSVASIVEEYYHSTSATTQVGGSWGTTVPTWADGKYVWIRTKTTFSNAGTSTTNPVNVTGSKGANGTIYYTWVKYADDANGGGLHDSPVGKRFIGIAVNQTSATEGTNGNAYTWSPLYDNVIVGGRNVVRYSNRFNTGAMATGITSSINSDGHLQVVSASGNQSWHTGWLFDSTGIEDSFNENDDVVISFEMKSTGHTSRPTIYLKAGVGYLAMNGTMSTNFSQIWTAFKWKKANPIAMHLGWSGVVGTTIIRNMKIEKGNIPTDWTLAPEDIQSDIDSKASSDVVETLTSEYNSALVRESNAITASVEKKITDSEGRLKEAIKSEVKQSADSFNISFTDIKGDISGLNGQMTEVKSYFDFQPSGLTIGKTDSPLNITISNSQIDFKDNGSKVAFINGKMMYIDSLEVLSSLLVGNHKIEKYNSEITVVKFSG